jgi:hypothetical protein
VGLGSTAAGRVGRALPPPGGVWNAGPINYWGYNEQPIWDPGQNGWGFWFFGIWIPL